MAKKNPIQPQKNNLRSIVELIKFDNDIQHNFYAKMNCNKGRSVRTLQEHISSIIGLKND